MKRIVTAVIGFLIILNIGNSYATPVHFKFKGTVTQAIFDPFDPFAGSIQFGTAFTGVYTFESTTPDAVPLVSNFGSYSIAGAPYGMTVDIGGNIISANDTLNISVADDLGFGVDQYSVFAQQGDPWGFGDFLTLNLFLEDNTGTALNNDSLPLSPPSLNDFLFRDFSLDARHTIGATTFQYQIGGTISALTVPEPDTMLLFLIGLVGVGLTYQQRRTKSERNVFSLCS